MKRELVRSAVVTVRLDPGVGSEIRKTRPAVIVSNTIACRFDAVVQVVPVTNRPDRDLRPYEATVESAGSGLTKPSRLVCNQIRTISKKRIGEVIGQIDDEELAMLDVALEIQIGLRR